MISMATASKAGNNSVNNPESITVAVSGSTGLIGSHLCGSLQASGNRVLRLIRDRSQSSSDAILCDPVSGIEPASLLEDADAIVHLAGENIASGRWTQGKKQRIRDSRIRGTRFLCERIGEMKRPPRVLISASAVGFYGNRGDLMLSESSPAGEGYLVDVCREWEAATQAAEDAGCRVVHLRIGVVISRHAGALAQMARPFRMGFGGRIGNGHQYWSWVHLEDVVGIIAHCIADDLLRGPVNCVAPNPVTNNEFTKTLGQVLNRPTLFPLPAVAARLILGQMANDLLLSSARVVPQRLIETDYSFSHANLSSALQAELCSV